MSPSTHLYVKQDRLGSVVGLDGHMQLAALAGTGVACTAKQLGSNPNPPLSAEARSKRRKGCFGSSIESILHGNNCDSNEQMYKPSSNVGVCGCVDRAEL
jgi:hypothetical protein